jgi:hypothetical protein
MKSQSNSSVIVRRSREVLDSILVRDQFPRLSHHFSFVIGYGGAHVELESMRVATAIASDRELLDQIEPEIPSNALSFASLDQSSLMQVCVDIPVLLPSVAYFDSHPYISFLFCLRPHLMGHSVI